MIKKALIICVIAVSGIVLYGQPVAKSLFLGGNVSLYYQNEKNDENDETRKTTQISLSPKIGYFITERTAIGLKVGVSSLVQKRESNYDEDLKVTEAYFNITPLMRYYFTKGAFGFFSEASCNIGFGKTKQSTSSYSEKGNITQVMVGISPGLYYYVHPRLALELSAGWFGYEYNSEEFDDIKRVRNFFGFDIETTGLSLGAIIIL